MPILTDTEIKDIRAKVAEARAEMPTSDLWKSTKFDERSLADLVILRESYVTLLEEYERKIALRVAQVRYAGASWAEVGKVLGMSKQAAQQKFGEWEGPLPVGDGKGNLG